MNIYGTLKSLDPAFADDQTTIWMAGQLFNGLVSFGPNLEIQPGIASSWEISDSGRKYTFHLRRDVFFHKTPLFGIDSTRNVTASDFQFSFARICDPQTASPGLAMFNGEVLGVEDFNTGKSGVVSGFQIPNDSTFVILLNRPFPAFLGTLAMPLASVVPKEVTLHFGKDFRKNPIGTGPFQFRKWTEDNSLVLIKNKNYFEIENEIRLPVLEAVHVRFIRNRLTEFMELLQGRLDLVQGVDPGMRSEIFKQSGELKACYSNDFELITGSYLNTEFIGFQVDTSLEIMRESPLKDPRIRRAMSFAIDRESLVKYLQKGFGKPAIFGLIPEGMPAYPQEKIEGFSYQPDSVSKLLDAAGYPSGKGLPTLFLKSQPAFQQLMEFLQKSWEQAGIPVQIDNVDGPVLRKMASEGSINLWRASWIGDYPDPQNYLALFYSHNIPPAGANRFRYRNPEFDQLYEAAAAETVDSLRTKIYLELEQLVMNDAVCIPLFYDRTVSLLNKKVKGFESNALNHLVLKRVVKTQ